MEDPRLAAITAGCTCGGLLSIAIVRLLCHFPFREVAFRRERRIAVSVLDHPIGVGIEVVNAVLGILSCGTYVVETYFDGVEVIKRDPYTWLLVAEVSFAVFFGLHFFLALFFAPYRTNYLFSFAGLVDMVSVPYIFALISQQDITSQAWPLWRYARIFRLQKCLDLIPELGLRKSVHVSSQQKEVMIKTQFWQVVLTLLAVIVYVAGLVEWLASVEGNCEWLAGADVGDCPALTMVDGLYFTVAALPASMGLDGMGSPPPPDGMHTLHFLLFPDPALPRPRPPTLGLCY